VPFAAHLSASSAQGVIAEQDKVSQDFEGPAPRAGKRIQKCTVFISSRFQKLTVSHPARPPGSFPVVNGCRRAVSAQHINK
jgi:hypothetical protein